MKTKRWLRLEVKEISADGSFEGMLSPYGNVDSTGDVVEPGAYTKTLQERGNKVPLLWQHNPALPIGELILEDRPEGLWCAGQLLMADSVAQRAYLFIKAKIVKGLSIGFETVKDAIENGVRHLKEIRLYEGSIVTFPANESALIASVKGNRETKGDFNEELTEIQLQDAGYQMRYALSRALDMAVWADGLTKEQKVTLAETIIQQFAEAYLAFLPAFLDLLAEMYGPIETWSQKRMETKSGRKFSAATEAAMRVACDQIKGGHEALLALLEEGAGDEGKSSTTLETKAASEKTEPDQLHSAIARELKSLEELMTWTPFNSN